MRFVFAILLGGLAAGALDIGYAIAAHGARGVPALTILQSVASGVLGRDAYSGGAPVAALGLGLHFAMTILMAAGFVMLAQIIPAMLRFPLPAGLAYGLFLFAVMNFAVVPLSAAYPGKFPEGWLLAGALFAHMALVGLPIALVARWILGVRG